MGEPREEREGSGEIEWCRNGIGMNAENDDEPPSGCRNIIISYFTRLRAGAGPSLFVLYFIAAQSSYRLFQADQDVQSLHEQPDHPRRLAVLRLHLPLWSGRRLRLRQGVRDPLHGEFPIKHDNGR